MNKIPGTKIKNTVNTDIHPKIDTLLNISIKAIEEMFNKENKTFYSKRKEIRNKVVNRGESQRYNLIALLGLYKASVHGLETKININDVIDHQITYVQKYKSIGDIGLLLWLVSLSNPEKLVQILPKINFNTILNEYKDSKRQLTTELSWFLIGLLSATIFNKNFAAVIKDLPHQVYQLIRNNYGGNGIFAHSGKSRLKFISRKRIGTFSDQVYSIYAFTMYAKVFSNEEALMIAMECADKLAGKQGEHGQWWWHYDSATGEVISKYPVFSVQQDALAPMAFLAIQRASGKNYTDYINKGINWLFSNNELRAKIVDDDKKIIYQSFSINTFTRYFNILLSVLFKLNFPKKVKLKVSKKTFLYHYGWVLFVFSELNTKKGIRKIPVNTENKKHTAKIFSINN